MICLYNKTETNFDHNGVCVLDPSVCTVSETAGGSYELYLEHPYDKHEKYLMLSEDMIIKAPVPHTVIPAITLQPTTKYTLAETTEFWKKLPVYKSKKTIIYYIRQAVRQGLTMYNWVAGRGYNAGDYCVYNNYIYLAKAFSFNVIPGTDSSVWAMAAPLGGKESQSEDTYTPGVEWTPALTVGATIFKIADYDSTYIQARDTLGRIGYIDQSKLTVVTTESEVIGQQVIDTQLFRIYSIESDEDSGTVKVYARHISYDFMGNKLMYCKMEEYSPADAIAAMQASLMIADNRRIACQFTEDKISEDWSFKNPINALLDPDTGLVPKLKARLIRNNENFYILKNDNPRTGITIERGVNLRGVTWNRNAETAVSRVVPRCHNGNDEYLYLEHGGTWSSATMMTSSTWVPNDDIYVESPVASEFPVPKIETMDCQYSVGEEYTPPGQTQPVKRDEASCRASMLEDAQKRFTVDHCDGMEITLTVNFILIGDTEQYKQYRGLQQLNIYDKITVRSKSIESTAQVTEYEYDSILGRYNSITVGNVDMFRSRVPGFRVSNESITYRKLSPDLINRIRSANGTAGEDTGGGSPGGGGVNIIVNVVDNLASTSATDALSANMGRVLNEKIISESVTATAGQDITIDWQRCRKSSELAIVEIAFTTGAAISAGATVIDDIPNIGGNQQHFFGISDSGLSYALTTVAGEIKTLVSIPTSTKIRFCLAFYPVT